MTLICGENAVFPARLLGCAMPIERPEEVFRCTDCCVPFHRECARRHFDNGEVLTEQMIAEMTPQEVTHADIVLGRARTEGIAPKSAPDEDAGVS